MIPPGVNVDFDGDLDLGLHVDERQRGNVPIVQL